MARATGIGILDFGKIITNNGLKSMVSGLKGKMF